jgi:hypothetical protein
MRYSTRLPTIGGLWTRMVIVLPPIEACQVRLFPNFPRVLSRGSYQVGVYDLSLVCGRRSVIRREWLDSFSPKREP